MSTSATSPNNPAPAAAPATDVDTVLCPLCEYDLRGLTEPRCPECGYRFSWSDVTDPDRRLHPYLFEHHPERPVASFVRTHLGGLRPKRFWTSLRPTQPSFPRRLVLYWCLTAAVLVSVIAGHYAEWTREFGIRSEFERNRWTKLNPPGSPFYHDLEKRLGGFENFLDQQCPVPGSPHFLRRAWRAEQGWTLFLAAVLVAWPWATFATLLVFRISMRRARIKPVHVLRCVLYSFDGCLWAGLLLAAMVAYRSAINWNEFLPRQWTNSPWVPTPPIPRAMPFSYRPDLVTDALFWVAASTLLWSGHRLTSAFRHYLKFDHPAATVAAGQLIVALTVLVTAMQTIAG